MAHTAQELTVTNSGQPLVVQIEAAAMNPIAQGVTPQIAANVTITITPAS